MVEPERPAALGAPMPAGQCSLCADLERDGWSEVDVERIGAVVLRRKVCVCDLCRRCGAEVTHVDVDPTAGDHG